MGESVFVGAAAWMQGGGAAAPGLFRMRGGDGRWERMTAGLPDPVEVRYLLVSPGDPRTIYAGTQEGPYLSRDGGESWQSMRLPGDARVVWSILLHPSDPETLYVGTERTNLFRTRDAGNSWERIAVPEPTGMIRAGFPMRVVRMAVDPTDPDQLYAAFEVGGLAHSGDGGKTWQDCNASLLELAEEERLKSTILSDLTHEGMLDSHAVTVSGSHPGTVYLANRMGLFVSDDKGAHWKELGIGAFSPLTYARDVQVSMHDPETIYAALSQSSGGDAGSLYRSRDFGRSWARFDHDVSIASTLMIIGQDPGDPDRIWCGARRGQIVGTDDGGRNWKTCPLPDGVEGVYAVACA